MEPWFVSKPMIIVAILRFGVEGLRYGIMFSRSIKHSKEASEGLYGEQKEGNHSRVAFNNGKTA